jgi:hypothetical protein
MSNSILTAPAMLLQFHKMSSTVIACLFHLTTSHDRNVDVYDNKRLMSRNEGSVMDDVFPCSTFHENLSAGAEAIRVTASSLQSVGYVGLFH